MSSKLVGSKSIVRLGSSISEKSFAQAADAEKYERIARAALSDIIVFQAVLEEEMQRMAAGERKGVPLDRELLEKMKIVNEKYMDAMGGFKEKNNERGRHALIVFADAVQDLMAYLHKQWKN